MSITHELAARILALRYDDLPEEAVYWAKQAMIDTIGVTFAGACRKKPSTSWAGAGPIP